MRADCSDACRAIDAKHHAVILEFVYSLTDTREKPQALGEPLTQAQAWQRHYGGKKASAKTASSRMMTGVDCAASLARHQMSKAERVEDDWVELRGRLVSTGRARLFDLVVAQDPDSDAIQSLVTGIRDGVEVVDKASGERRNRDLTPKELQVRIDKAAAWRMKRPPELTEAQKEAITEVSWDPSRGILRYKLEALPAMRLLSEVDGKRSIAVDVRTAESLQAAPWERIRAELLPVLEAFAASIAAGAGEEVDDWFRAKALSLAESGRFPELHAERFREWAARDALGPVEWLGVLVGVGVG